MALRMSSVLYPSNPGPQGHERLSRLSCDHLSGKMSIDTDLGIEHALSGCEFAAHRPTCFFLRLRNEINGLVARDAA